MTKENKVVKFVCPKCKHNNLECCMDGPHTCQVTEINIYGDHEYGEYESTATVSRWQCAYCGYVLKNGDDPIWDNSDVAQWCLDYCSQE